MTFYLAHGLVWDSDVGLDCRTVDDPRTADSPVAADGPVAADVVVRLTPPAPVPRDRPTDGRCLALVDGSAGPWSTVTGTAEGAGERVDIYFHGVGLASIAPTLNRIDLTMDPTADPDLAPVLLGGTVLSVLLTLRGSPVLHASCVTVDGPAGAPVAVAFVGRSGMGKSTLATLACRDGALLLTDDVLRAEVDPVDGLVRVWPGTTATRLRPQAADLGRSASTAATQTADGRLSTPLLVARDERVRLGVVVIPVPDREIGHVEIDVEPPVRAMLLLASFPRLGGWRDPRTSALAHHRWAELAQRVVVVRAGVPWGPPFAPRLGGDVVGAALEAARLT